MTTSQQVENNSSPHELVLYLENTERLARCRDNIYRMLAKKKDKKTYDKRLAPRAFAYLLRTTAEGWAKEIDRSGTPYYRLFPVVEREQAARELTDKFEQWYKYDRLARISVSTTAKSVAIHRRDQVLSTRKP
jgi:hypothetical protein